MSDATNNFTNTQPTAPRSPWASYAVTLASGATAVADLMSEFNRHEQLLALYAERGFCDRALSVDAETVNRSIDRMEVELRLGLKTMERLRRLIEALKPKGGT